MNQQSSEWAMGEARKIVNQLSFGEISGPHDLANRIALALDAARKVPDGCVRLPDGRDIEPPYYVPIVPSLLQTWEEYTERAAEATRKDGTR